ncbi:hypothetical protein Tco_0075502, partial [Tanacetum coccineum]
KKSKVFGGSWEWFRRLLAADPPPIAVPRQRQRLVKLPWLLRWCSGLAEVKRRDGGGGEGGRSVDLVGGIGGGWHGVLARKGGGSPEKSAEEDVGSPENFSGGGAGQWRLPEMGEEGKIEF